MSQPTQLSFQRMHHLPLPARRLLQQTALIYRLIFSVCFAMSVLLYAVPVQAAASTVVIDDFESGVDRWTRNDKVKSDNPASGVMLVDVVSTRTSEGGPPESSAAGLFSYKTATNSWASASIRVSGAAWAKAGAQRLTFWLNADGEEQGTELVLRANYRQSDGTTRDESFTVPVRLRNTSWRRVVIPLSDIRNENGPLLPRLSGVYLLQFVQRGTWDSRFFTVDQLQIEGTGVPLAGVTPSGVPTAPAGSGALGGSSTANPAAPPTAAETTNVSVDFLRRQGVIRTSANVSIGAALPGATGAAAYPLQGSAAFRRAISTLKPRVVRLDAAALTELVDSARPAFNFSRLAASARQVRALGAEPLLAITVDPSWGLDTRGYTVFAVGAVRAVNTGNPRPTRLFELATGTGSLSNANAVAWFNSARKAIKALSPYYRVGGIAASSGNLGTQAALLSGAQGIDFVSVSYYGGSGTQPGESALFSAARSINNLRAATAALDRSKFRNVPLYVTQANLNGTRDANTFLPADVRTAQMVAGAWWATFMSSSSRLADQVFHNDANNPEWGLLDERAWAYPPYYVLWMWNKFLPPGSTRVLATARRGTTGSNDVVVVAANTPASHNVLLANTRDRNTTVKLSIRGFPILRAATLHVLDEPRVIRQSVALPKSPVQTIVLRPYSVAVVQFIEPPKR